MLQGELQKHAWDMRAWRMVIANKADLLGGDGNPEEVRLARARLAQLKEMDNGDRTLDVVPTSAKYSQNIRCINY